MTSAAGPANTAATESRLRAALGLLPTAALIFGVLAWGWVFYNGAHRSEREGVAASWIPIFPMVAGGVARWLRLRSIERGAPQVFRPLAAGAGAGVVALLLLWLFYVGIWPSL